MSEQPEALRLADRLDGSSNGPLDVRHKAAAELRRLHELAESEGRWASDYMKRAVTLEAALRQAVEAMEMVAVDVKTTPNAYEATRQAIAAAKQALGEQT